MFRRVRCRSECTDALIGAVIRFPELGSTIRTWPFVLSQPFRVSFLKRLPDPDFGDPERKRLRTSAAGAIPTDPRPHARWRAIAVARVPYIRDSYSWPCRRMIIGHYAQKPELRERLVMVATTLPLPFDAPAGSRDILDRLADRALADMTLAPRSTRRDHFAGFHSARCRSLDINLALPIQRR